ncbi:hypothetical protein PYCCODRAFT_1398958 [Trametes coccinea BRFM310]|uniref:DUF6533 domain-containing protein n=1 Tax=Trametes coccinea (strain BRFM310) TaxID=1353009 RepID=A0A1Y2I829_TRAC3|nr:hypothetical protein PYCCODRAFT_1398958 [Trametes coccinea BRFM310]
MSSGEEAYIAAVGTLINETYYTLAAFVLLAFEYVITLDREVHLVWGRKLTGATVLFVLNRYWLFLEYISQVITMFPISEKSCNVVNQFVIIGNAGPPLIWAAFSTLRGYALSGRKWWIAPVIFVFYLPHFILNCVYYASLSTQLAPPPFNCGYSTALPEKTWIEFTIASRSCLIVGDLIVLAITWRSTFGITRAANVARVRMSLTNAILKDGTIYFVCLLILNVINIVVNVVARTSAVSAFQDPITSILVSRFLLNLRDTFDHNEHDTRPSFVRSRRGPSVLTTVQFADFVDPMGAELTHSFPSSSVPSMTWTDETGAWSEESNELSSLSAATQGRDYPAEDKEPDSAVSPA